MSNEGLRPRSVGLRGDWIASITNVAPTAATTLTMAALITATRPGRTWADALAAGQAGYREAGFDGEWREHVQGGPIGYLSREFDVVPGTEGAAQTIAAGTAFAWNPTVRGAKSEDTFVVTRSGPRPVTYTADWPVVPGGRPAILLT